MYRTLASGTCIFTTTAGASGLERERDVQAGGARPRVATWRCRPGPLCGACPYYPLPCRSNLLDPTAYPPAKFVSEFGFQSWPSWPAYAAATAPHDWALAAPMTGFRLRRATGMAEVLGQMQMHMLPPPGVLAANGSGAAGAAGSAGGLGAATAPLPSAQPPPPPLPAWPPTASPEAAAAQLRAFTYLSQLQQALIYDAAVMQWRRLKSNPSALTMGVLYWQARAGAGSSGHLGGPGKVLPQPSFCPLPPVLK